MQMQAVRLDVGAPGPAAGQMPEVQLAVLEPGSAKDDHAQGKVAHEKRLRRREARRLEKI